MGKTDKSALEYFKSLYTDPFKWSLVKSVSMFAVAVLFAREMATASIEPSPPS